jgi:flagellar biosynthesis regulator FlaF
MLDHNPMADDVLTRIKHAARYGRIIMSRHAEEERLNANARPQDVYDAILSATHVVLQKDVYRLEGGTSRDGEPLIVVVREVQAGLFVITVF